MSRPQNLGEASAAVIAGAKPFGHAIDEFLDTFYLDHPDKLRQQQRIDDVRAIVGDAFVDSWIGAVGEHFARRSDLSVPAWTRRPAHDTLALPRFVPDSKASRRTLLLERPPAFRSLRLFTFVGPSRRARFPREVDRIKPQA
jgi:hypothetical protein